jgi:hypothetical protein
MTGPRPVVSNQQLTVLRMLADRRRSLGDDHTRICVPAAPVAAGTDPGGAKKDLSAAQAKVLLAKVRPRMPRARPGRGVAAGLVSIWPVSTSARRPLTKN